MSCIMEVKVEKDQEIAQSERNFPLQTPKWGKKLN